jgi:hypothetical protein
MDVRQQEALIARAQTHRFNTPFRLREVAERMNPRRFTR